MRVHHLNCGSLDPLLIGHLVCHVLLCETGDGLVLVDSGFGLADVADHRRIGPMRVALRAAFDADETAARQVERLGFARSDVRHILVTHFDLDHIGGLADFPAATVHTTAAEWSAATSPPTLRERERYRPIQWAHDPTVVQYAGPGTGWLGFADAHQPVGLDARFAIVPMPGHTRGHACVAVDTGDGWILHAGDAVFHRTSIAPDEAAGRRVSRLGALAFEQAVALRRSAVAGNHRRLAELAARLDVTVVPAHDPVVFDRLAGLRTRP